jgi:2-succinyl-5-enolpyruvyl-6-hydroxy-3-cyclohexene-1-carboxylate synthase
MNNPLKWSAELISSLYSQGAEYAIISPGSRSAPLTIAAALHPHLKKKVVLDERSAAYIALGIGKATGKPALLICTSGTALANYLPAVTEAKESGTPMIVLSADRPPNLRGIGSSQTIDQIKLFGNYAVFFHDTGEPILQKRDLNRIRYLAKQAVDHSILKGGTSHINLPFRKPLEPGEEQIEEVRKFFKNSDLGIKTENGYCTINPGKEIHHLLENASRPLLIAGPANSHHQLPEQLQLLAGKLAAPVICEPGCGMDNQDYLIHRYDQFLRNSNVLNELVPDVIIRFGDQPFTNALLNAMECWDGVPVIHVASRPETQDHALSVTHTLFVNRQDQIDLHLANKKNGTEWLNKWLEFDSKANKKLLDSLDDFRSLTDGHVFHHFARELGNEWNVMLSNSFPARDMALFGGTAARQFVNRGAAGIDGIISTALGIHFGTGKPTCCLTGDLAFLHDTNALLSIKQSELPVIIVVINNGGGTIFRMLPVYNTGISLLRDEIFTQYFETPQQTHIKYLALASGLKFQRIDSPDELRSFHPDSIRESMIVELITNPDESLKQRQHLWGF